MASLNRVTLIGNLGRDPELRYTPSGKAVVNFSMATTERWNSRESGEKQERTEWHNIVLWGRQAEIANQYLKKGSSCYIEGRLATRSWEDKDNIKRYRTEIEGLSLQLLSSGSGYGGGRNDAPPQPDEYFDSYPDPMDRGAPPSPPSGGGASDGAGSAADDDLPF